MEFLPGFCQGIVKVILSYPFDVTKVYMQKEIHKTMFSAFSNILASDPRILYRGAVLPLTIIPIERALTLTWAEKLNQRGFSGYTGGFIIGATSSFYYVPMQYVTTNAVLTRRCDYKNIFHFIRRVPPTYVGFVPEFIRASLASSIFFGTYMWIRDLSLIKSPHSPLIYGPVASIFSWICIFPLDTIRTERQTSVESVSMIIREKLRRAGVKSFYRGITPVIMRTIPSTSLGMWVYEKIRT
jgi:hypothetical protein